MTCNYNMSCSQSTSPPFLAWCSCDPVSSKITCEMPAKKDAETSTADPMWCAYDMDQQSWQEMATTELVLETLLETPGARSAGATNEDPTRDWYFDEEEPIAADSFFLRTNPEPTWRCMPRNLLRLAARTQTGIFFQRSCQSKPDRATVQTGLYYLNMRPTGLYYLNMKPTGL